MRGTRGPAVAVVLLAVAGLVAGCGLPLPGGVQSAGEVPGDQTGPVGIQVLSPGPQPGATAEELVRGFLQAQGSPDDSHAVARRFLAPRAVWDDDQFVVVYGTGTASVRADPADPGRLEVRLEPLARIADDGSYRLEPPDQLPTPEQFRVDRGLDGELRLSQVPAGLRITADALLRSYAPQDVFYLGRAGGPDVRLVPDRVFLPVATNPARGLVEALLRGQSRALAGSVTTAVPVGTTVRDVTLRDDIVTVDLAGPLDALDLPARRRLSAQLAWTLQAFSGFRLLLQGQELDVGGVGPVQTTRDWTAYDPAGLEAGAPLYYLQDGLVRSLDQVPLTGGQVTDTGPVRALEAAVNPTDGRLAVTTRAPGGVEVRLGTLTGPLGPPVLRRRELASLSWGSGQRGLWVLEGGDQPQLWLLGSGADPVRVDVQQPAGAGVLTRVEVSRDGSRVALVFGRDAARQLYLGRVSPSSSGGPLSVVDVRALAPSLRDVTDVAWESGTSLVVLAADLNQQVLLVLQVAIDGSSSAPVQRPGVEGVPVAVAAAPGRDLVVAAAERGQPPRLFRDDGTTLAYQAQGSAPFYPG